MSTSVKINPSLLKEAFEIGGLKTKKATVERALKEYTQRRKLSHNSEPGEKDNYYFDYDYNRKVRHRKRPFFSFLKAH